MENEFRAGFYLGVFLVAAIILGASVAWHVEKTAMWQAETVKHGCAEWITETPANGAEPIIEWRWKE